MVSGWLGPEMPDLNTESPNVIRTLHHWIQTMVTHFGIDMIRVDTVKHVRKSFWPDFVRAGGVPAMGEVLHGGEWLSATQRYIAIWAGHRRWTWWRVAAVVSGGRLKNSTMT